MGTWNYRVMKKGDLLGIYEVHYDDDGKVKGYSADPMPPIAEDVNELQNTLDLMRRAIELPVLQYDV